MVTNFNPAEPITVRDVREHFEHEWGQVASVTLAKYSEAFLTRHSKTSDINEDLSILEARANKAQQDAKEKGNQFPVYWIHDTDARFAARRTLATRTANHVLLVTELEANRKRLDKLKESLTKQVATDEKTYAAFVIFHDRSSQEKCLLERHRGYMYFLCCQPLHTNNPKFMGIRIQPAPEPSNLIFENLEYGSRQRFLRSLLVSSLAAALLLASFAGILQAQLYQKKHPLPQCPPRLLETEVDKKSRSYFANTHPTAWGPGTRGTGIEPTVALGQGLFTELKACSGGPTDGAPCLDATDCTGGVKGGVGVCTDINLQCGYWPVLAASPVADLGTGDKGRFMDKNLVVDAQGGNASHLRWDTFESPPFCDMARKVVRTSVSASDVSVSVSSPSPSAYTYTAADFDSQNALLPTLCASLIPTASCPTPPPSCAEYPGCLPSAAGWTAIARCASGTLASCSQAVTFTNGTAVEEADDPDTTWLAERCGAGTPGSCQRVLTAHYAESVRTYEEWDTYAAEVCARYEKVCTSCFCVDTITDFWLVWIFSLSEGYSGVCSAQFGTLVQEVLLFVAAVASVVVVNMALKTGLRMFAGFEKKPTVTETEKSITLKVFLAQFFNTAFVPLLVYARLEALAKTTCQDGTMEAYNPARPTATFGWDGMPCDPEERADGTPVCALGGGVCRALAPDAFPIFAGEYSDFNSAWYSKVAASILVTVMVNTMLTLMPLMVEWPIQLLQEAIARRSAVTQRQLNRALEGPSFELAARYGVLLNTIFVAMLYSAGSPLLYLVAAAACLLSYLADKLALHKLYRTPPRYDASLAMLAGTMLPLSAFLHVAFAAWKYSSVMPAVPVWSEINKLVQIGLDEACRGGDDPFKCSWECQSGTLAGRSCAHVANGLLNLTAGLCEAGGGECHGSDPSLLQFNFSARMLSWAAFPALIFLILCVVYVVLTRIVANPVVRRALAPLVKAACGGCCQPGKGACCCVPNCSGDDDDEGEYPAYPEALRITAQAVMKEQQSESASSWHDPARGGGALFADMNASLTLEENPPEDDASTPAAAESGAGEVARGAPPGKVVRRKGGHARPHWHGVPNYDLTRLGQYAQAFEINSEIPMADNEERRESYKQEAHTWSSPSVLAALAFRDNPDSPSLPLGAGLAPPRAANTLVTSGTGQGYTRGAAPEARWGVDNDESMVSDAVRSPGACDNLGMSAQEGAAPDLDQTAERDHIRLDDAPTARPPAARASGAHTLADADAPPETDASVSPADQEPGYYHPPTAPRAGRRSSLAGGGGGDGGGGGVGEGGAGEDGVV
ncbi:hypothetical protein T484DRAFT_3546799 [Baffinella frigidus]|nr:hypothetical protein T484DRAFT_3546799 [Cryptophyta sp. CCMP2293]